MLNRKGLRRCLTILYGNLGGDRYRSQAMAVLKQPSTMNIRGFCQLSEANKQSMAHRKFFLTTAAGDRVCSGKTFRLLGCLNNQDGLRKPEDDLRKPSILAPYRELVRDSGFVFKDEVGAKILSGDGARSNGNSLLFPGHHSMPAKLVVAVDVDEVLGSFLSALNKFIADHYCANHSVSEYYVYEFFKIWNCSRTEADIRVHEFFTTSYFKMGIHPIPGARNVLNRLSKFCQLSVVTSRQNAIKEHTLEWIENHYPGLFQEVHFGNHFALDGQSRPKSEICRSLGAHVLIDDNPRYALECAEVGIHVLLFDYDDSYPWSKTGSATSHPLVTKVHNWQEVEDQLLALVPS